MLFLLFCFSLTCYHWLGVYSPFSLFNPPLSFQWFEYPFCNGWNPSIRWWNLLSNWAKNLNNYMIMNDWANYNLLGLVCKNWTLSLLPIHPRPRSSPRTRLLWMNEYPAGGGIGSPCCGEWFNIVVVLVEFAMVEFAKAWMASSGKDIRAMPSSVRTEAVK